VTTAASRHRWVNYAACLWAVLFAAPHVWWALDIPAGFPGGRANHLLMMNTWRYYFDLAVIALSVVAIIIALAPVQRWGERIAPGLLRATTWAASTVLTLRGVAGLIADGSSDPVWWPTFLVGGVLFGMLSVVGRREQGTRKKLQLKDSETRNR
jgi:hypothetical protein